MAKEVQILLATREIVQHLAMLRVLALTKTKAIKLLGLKKLQAGDNVILSGSRATRLLAYCK